VSDQKIKRTLAKHALWLAKNGGNRANLSGVNLREINLREANLCRADLRWADLRWADLCRANLRRANLRWADLREVNLSEANLRWANLSEANLSGANLCGADLSGASLSGADLRWADLSGAVGIRYAQCSFDAHGESGRQLSGVVIAGELRLFCGCFSGTLAELDAYIDNGDERYKATRKLARDFIVAAIDSVRKEAKP
jgi:hypothetical protein